MSYILKSFLPPPIPTFSLVHDISTCFIGAAFATFLLSVVGKAADHREWIGADRPGKPPRGTSPFASSPPLPPSLPSSHTHARSHSIGHGRLVWNIRCPLSYKLLSPCDCHSNSCQMMVQLSHEYSSVCIVTYASYPHPHFILLR